MWGTSLPEDKLAGDLGKRDWGHIDRRSSVGFFYSKKIGAGQFGTFATISAKTRLMHRSKQAIFSGRRRDKFIDKRCNNHRRIVAYGVLNCATSPTDHAMVDPGSYRFWVRNDSVLTTTGGSLLRSTTQFVRELPEAMRQRASIRDDH